MGNEETYQYLQDRKKAYQLTFDLSQPANEFVMEDLARFCRANESCLVPGDHDRTIALEARREVWLRIQQHLGLTTEQLFSLYSGNSPQQRNKK